MNKRLLTDESLRDDLYCELMFTAGYLAMSGIKGDLVREMVEEQLNLLMPVVKKHIKRHKRAPKEAL